VRIEKVIDEPLQIFPINKGAAARHISNRPIGLGRVVPDWDDISKKKNPLFLLQLDLLMTDIYT
jgi:hypothetical protein